MSFNEQLGAPANPYPGNSMREVVAGYADYLNELLRQNKINNKQLKILYCARFDRNAGQGVFDPSDAALEIFKQTLQKEFVYNSQNLELDLEYLLNQEDDVRGDQKLLKLVNRFGQRLELYSSYRKRALASLFRKGRPNPTPSEVQLEIQAIRANLESEYDSPDHLDNAHYQGNDPSRNTFKVFIDDEGNVSFEYPIDARNQAEMGRLRARNIRMQEKANAARAVAAARAARNGADQQEPNYNTPANILGNYYDTPEVVPAKPDLAQSAQGLLALMKALVGQFMELVMGIQQTYNNNTKKSLGTKNNGDLFEKFSSHPKLDENTKNNLHDAWNNAENAGNQCAAIRENLFLDLKNELAVAGLFHERDYLNLKLGVKMMEETALAHDPSLQNQKRLKEYKAYIERIWNQGHRKEAFSTLHRYMEESGLFVQMDETLQAEELLARDSGPLAGGSNEAIAARKSYTEALAALHQVPLHEASDKFQRESIAMRQQMLEKIAAAEKKLKEESAAYSKVKTDYEQSKKDHDAAREEMQRLQDIGDANLQDIADPALRMKLQIEKGEARRAWPPAVQARQNAALALQVAKANFEEAHIQREQNQQPTRAALILELTRIRNLVVPAAPANANPPANPVVIAPNAAAIPNAAVAPNAAAAAPNAARPVVLGPLDIQAELKRIVDAQAARAAAAPAQQARFQNVVGNFQELNNGAGLPAVGGGRAMLNAANNAQRGVVAQQPAIAAAAAVNANRLQPVNRP